MIGKENVSTGRGPAKQGSRINGDHPEFAEFVATIAALRAPGGCPWDREQTHISIASNMIEEAYEAVDAIELKDGVHLQEELGDVLLQVVLQSQIAADEGEFTIDDVCRGINEKIVRRHPHVFGDIATDSAEEVHEIWDKVKLTEKKEGQDISSTTSQPVGLLDSVPRGFPALMQAQKISRKAVSAGFEWNNLDEVWDKVFEEIEELREAYADMCQGQDNNEDGLSHVEVELGDVLFSLVNVARKMGIDAESALRRSCSKFRDRWSFMEGAAWAQGRRIEDLPFEDKQRLWDEAKARELSIVT